MPRTARPRCVVIGAGLAGLAAAHELRRRQWDVEVFEARARLGGRVFSHVFSDAPDVVCELGGEWIGNGHPRMKALVKGFGLGLQPHQFSVGFEDETPFTLHPPGAWCFSQKSEATFKAFEEKYHHYRRSQQAHLDQFDWWGYLRMLGFSEPELRRRDLMDATDFGESIRQTSAFMAASEYFESGPTDDMDLKVEHGNTRLIEALAKAVGQRSVHAGRRVTGVRHP